MTARTPTLSGLLAENQRLYRCINAAMDCINLKPESRRPEDLLCWLRLLDALEGREPRDNLTEEEKK